MLTISTTTTSVNLTRKHTINMDHPTAINQYYGLIKYIYLTEAWGCELCKYTTNKYNWLQIHGNVRSKHDNTAQTNNTDPLAIIPAPRINLPIEHITPIELHQINMEVGYGRICINFNRSDNVPNNWNMILKCNKCGDEFKTIDGVKVHYAWRNDINVHCDAVFPISRKRSVNGQALAAIYTIK